MCSTPRGHQAPLFYIGLGAFAAYQHAIRNITASAPPSHPSTATDLQASMKQKLKGGEPELYHYRTRSFWHTVPFVDVGARPYCGSRPEAASPVGFSSCLCPQGCLKGSVSQIVFLPGGAATVRDSGLVQARRDVTSRDRTSRGIYYTIGSWRWPNGLSIKGSHSSPSCG